MDEADKQTESCVEFLQLAMALNVGDPGVVLFQFYMLLPLTVQCHALQGPAGAETQDLLK